MRRQCRKNALPDSKFCADCTHEIGEVVLVAQPDCLPVQRLDKMGVDHPVYATLMSVVEAIKGHATIVCPHSGGYRVSLHKNGEWRDLGIDWISSIPDLVIEEGP